jgi:hypothetical protein
MAMRLPAKGSRNQTLKPVDSSKAWLAPFMGGAAEPVAEYKGHPAEAGWLPNESVARAWMEYVKTGSASDPTPPLPPSNVQAASTQSGTEITWDAEADFESGIGGFIIMRDGKELVRLPETPPANSYGRPLFQAMSYHDTPEPPVPEMRYLDGSAKPGEKHTYSIIAVNSAGLASKPSDGKATR